MLLFRTTFELTIVSKVFPDFEIIMKRVFFLLIKLADDYSINLSLIAYPMKHDIDEIDDFKEASRLNELNNKYLNNQELELFYEKFGFVRIENDSSDTPFMVRKTQFTCN